MIWLTNDITETEPKLVRFYLFCFVDGFGRFIYILEICTVFMSLFTGRRNANGSFDWKNALIDSAIVAAVDFFTTLGGLGVAGLFADPA